MFFKKKKQIEYDKETLPKHIAFICDGNRRWARTRGLPTLLGHKEGVEAIKRVVRRASELNIENLTFFCFSTENFDRSKEEIDYLFDLFRSIVEIKPNLIELGYKLHHTGDKSMLPDDLNEIIDGLEKDTAAGDKGTINLAKGKMLSTSIPYDKGWSVYVDGDKVAEENILKIGQAMLGINIDRGAHEVEFKFEARGLKLGIIVSVATLVFAVLNILGMKFRLVNKVLGIALILLAVCL